MRKLMLLFHVLLLAVTGAAPALSPLGKTPRCFISGRMFVLELGWAKSPTYAGVELPTGRFLQLRYPPNGVDTLGSGYDRGRVRVPVAALKGIGSTGTMERVFVTPGAYRFVMRDATTAENMELHTLQCSVALPPRGDAHSGA